MRRTGRSTRSTGPSSPGSTPCWSGLTATPKDEVDRNTYTLFNLEDGVPTDAYGLDEAVAEGYLVPPVAVSVPTKFLREGIRYDELSEQEKDDWDALEWNEDGDIPDAVSGRGAQPVPVQRRHRRQGARHADGDGHKVAGGDRLGKTIIFAKNQAHAEFIKQRFDVNYPEYAGHFARVITHSVTYAQSLIDDFSIKDKAPHIAISVDMLDTGIDVPEVVNLVFFKLVRAKSKFWQMIGRGTRLCPDLFGPGEDKKNFYVFDFCGNLEFFSQDLPGSEGSVQKSLAERLFETRLGLVTALDQTAPSSDTGRRPGGRGRGRVRARSARRRRLVAAPGRRRHERRQLPGPPGPGMGRDLRRVGRLAAPDHRSRPATSPATSPGCPRPSATTTRTPSGSTCILLRLQLARLEGDAMLFERLRKQVQDIATALLGQTAIPSVKAQEQLLDQLAGDEWWVDVTLPMLELARRRVRALVRFVDKTKRAVVYSDFADELGEGTIVDLPGVTPGTNWERFRAKARAYLRDHEDHLALQRLRRNLPAHPRGPHRPGGDAARVRRRHRGRHRQGPRGVPRTRAVRPLPGRPGPRGRHRGVRPLPDRHARSRPTSSGSST